MKIWDEDTFKERMDLLKNLDLLVALDDLILSSITTDKILSYNPDFIKLDRSCSNNLSRSTSKQKAIHSLVTISEDSIVVLEGIEEEEDFAAASRLGVPTVQGYYIAKPHRL
jgi:EAL domain-containing protein (putative c-di-GMP-specific phosphodiesterase class I)